MWPFRPIDSSHYYTPYLPLVFADNDQTIIARDGSRLFSVSVASIKNAGTGTDE
jgi:hypothetical protein